MRTTADLHPAGRARPGGRGPGSTAPPRGVRGSRRVVVPAHPQVTGSRRPAPGVSADDGAQARVGCTGTQVLQHASAPAQQGCDAPEASGEHATRTELATRMGHATRTKLATRTGHATRTELATRTGHATRAELATRTGHATRTELATRTGHGVLGCARPGRAVAVRARAVARAARSRLVAGSDVGMATAEYAIATVAAVGFAGLLVVVLKSGEVQGLLLGLIRGALSV